MANEEPITIDAEEVLVGTPEDVKEIKESEFALDGILEADFSDPTEIKVRRNFKPTNRAYQYYQSIYEKLPDWWEEFASQLHPKSGAPLYVTVAQFARSRTSNREEREWIEKMIGPKPATYNVRSGQRGRGLSLKVPWLGDWKQRRANGYWATDQPKRIETLIKGIKAKLRGLDAVQSAAPYLVQMMARYTKVEEQIDALFGGQAVDVSKGPHDQRNNTRFYQYLEMQKSVTRIKLRLLHEWMRVHGVDPEHPTESIKVEQNNLLMINQQGKPTIAGAADELTLKDMQAVKLMKMLPTHADNFKMPLPDTEPTKVPVKEAVPEKPAKSNGKVM